MSQKRRSTTDVYITWYDRVRKYYMKSNSSLDPFSVSATCSSILLHLNTAHWIIDGTAVPFQHQALPPPPPPPTPPHRLIHQGAWGSLQPPSKTLKMFNLKRALVFFCLWSMPFCARCGFKLHLQFGLIWVFCRRGVSLNINILNYNDRFIMRWKTEVRLLFWG